MIKNKILILFFFSLIFSACQKDTISSIAPVSAVPVSKVPVTTVPPVYTPTTFPCTAAAPNVAYKFGANGSFICKTFAPNTLVYCCTTVTCGTQSPAVTFGAVDPAPGFTKNCYDTNGVSIKSEGNNFPAVAPALGDQALVENDSSGLEIRLSTREMEGGAVSSLLWNNREFLDSSDHGRELQSDVNFDGLGECNNPTEAGSHDDAAGFKSSSVVLSMNNNPNTGTLTSTTQMAYFYQPGEPYPAGCGGNKKITTVPIPNVQTGNPNSPLSDVTLDKTIQMYPFGTTKLTNVFRYEVTFHVPDTHTKALFEYLISIMPDVFSQYYLMNFSSETPSTATSSLFSSVVSSKKITAAGTLNLATIVATADGKYALGMMADDRLSPSGPSLYGYYSYLPNVATAASDTFVSLPTATIPYSGGAHSFTEYLVVGTLATVESTLPQLRDAVLSQAP
jgi:hypothetical protein